MRRLTLFIALLLPRAAGAEVRVEPHVVQLGEIRGGTTAEARFTIVNRGNQRVDLIDLERSCGCVQPTWPTRTLELGANATLTLKLRTLGQAEGSRSWPLTLVVREGDVVLKHRLEIRADIRNEISLKPPQVAIYVTDLVEQEIALVDRRSTPLRVESWEVQSPGVRVERLASDKGTLRFKLIAEASKIPVGRHDSVVTLLTDDPEYRRLEVPLSLVRVLKPRITWTPETPELILAAGQSKASVLVTLRGPIETIEAADGLTVAWAASEGGAAARVSVDRANAGRLQSSLRVRSAGETTAIPIVIRAE